MKTLYLKRLRSGNYEISNREDHTIKFNRVNKLKTWYKQNVNGYTKYNSSFGSRIIKARYRLSQVYFSSVDELLNFIKK